LVKGGPSGLKTGVMPSLFFLPRNYLPILPPLRLVAANFYPGVSSQALICVKLGPGDPLGGQGDRLSPEYPSCGRSLGFCAPYPGSITGNRYFLILFAKCFFFLAHPPFLTSILGFGWWFKFPRVAAVDPLPGLDKIAVAFIPSAVPQVKPFCGFYRTIAPHWFWESWITSCFPHCVFTFSSAPPPLHFFVSLAGVFGCMSFSFGPCSPLLVCGPLTDRLHPMIAFFPVSLGLVPHPPDPLPDLAEDVGHTQILRTLLILRSLTWRGSPRALQSSPVPPDYHRGSLPFFPRPSCPFSKSGTSLPLVDTPVQFFAFP